MDENTPIDQGEIYWITLPSRGGREQSGRRPCIVMSRTGLNRGNPVVVVPLTSNLKKANSYNIKIPVSEMNRDVGSTANLVDSVALCGHTFSIDKRKLEEKIGKLTHLAVLSVQLGLSYLFDIR